MSQIDWAVGDEPDDYRSFQGIAPLEKALAGGMPQRRVGRYCFYFSDERWERSLEVEQIRGSVLMLSRSTHPTAESSARANTMALRAEFIALALGANAIGGDDGGGVGGDALKVTPTRGERL